MTSAIQNRKVFSCVVVLTLALAALIALPVVAQEAEKETDKSATIDVEVNQVGVPLLSQIPYVNKLFRNIGVSVSCATCDSDGCQFVAPEMLQVVCQQPCCQQVAAYEVLSSPVCEDRSSPAAFEEITKFELIQSLTEAMSRVSALEAALEAREEFEEQKHELFSSLAEAMIENAELEAHGNSLQDQLATHAEIAQTKIENAKLQAKLELVTQREQMVRVHTQALAENQRLKTQLAKLEKLRSGLLVAKKAQAAAENAEKQKRAIKR